MLYKKWRHFKFEKEGFLDGVCLPEILTSEPNFCLKVHDDNLRDTLIEKLAALSYARLFL